MNTSSKLACAVVAVAGMVAAGSALTSSANAQAPVVTPKPTAAVAQGLNCGGETAIRVEVDRPHDVQVSMSRPAGASSWNTMLVANGRVATLDRPRSCGNAPIRLQVTAEDADARSALQTCAIMGASVGSGQKLVLTLRATEGARAGAGGALMMVKPVQIDCGVE